MQTAENSHFNPTKMATKRASQDFIPALKSSFVLSFMCLAQWSGKGKNMNFQLHMLKTRFLAKHLHIKIIFNKSTVSAPLIPALEQQPHTVYFHSRSEFLSCFQMKYQFKNLFKNNTNRGGVLIVHVQYFDKFDDFDDLKLIIRSIVSFCPCSVSHISASSLLNEVFFFFFPFLVKARWQRDL